MGAGESMGVELGILKVVDKDLWRARPEYLRRGPLRCAGQIFVMVWLAFCPHFPFTGRVIEVALESQNEI